jgi:hypothetical protein
MRSGKRGTVFAINIADLANTKAGNDFCMALLLNPVLNRDTPVKTERDRFDGMGALLNCDDEQGQAIVDIVRKHYRRHEVRIYHSKTGKGWKRV